MLNSTERIPYTIYHYLSLISIILAIFTIGIAIKRKSKHLEHTTATILMACFIFVSFLKSVVASALTIGLLNFNAELIDVTTKINTNLVIMGLTVYLKFIILLIVIDLGLRAKLYKAKINSNKNYGNSILSIAFCIVGLGITFALSAFLAGIIIFIRQAGINFLLYYRVTIGAVQTMSILCSLFLYFFINKLRQKSYSSSSLSLRHECVKNVVLLRNYLPMVSTDAFIGSIALMITVCGSAFFDFSLSLGFPIFYLFIELSTIVTFIGIIRRLHKTNRIGVFNGVFESQGEASLSVVSVRTMTNAVPTTIPQEDYFNKLQKAWK